MIDRELDLTEITDPHDERLADYVRLRETSLRRSLESARGLFIAEGEKVIRRACASGHRPRSFLLAERWLASLAEVINLAQRQGRDRGELVPVYVVTESVAEQVTGFHVHRGALASMHRRAQPTAEELIGELSTAPRSRIAVLEDLVDHANVGAVFRSAAALGVDAVLLSPHCADPLYRRAIKVSMGAVFQVPWARVEPWPQGLAAITGSGHLLVGMTLGEGAITLAELAARAPDRLALVFGSEGPGLSPGAERAMKARVRIPMRLGVDSLNVAAASAVAFYVTQ